MSGVPPRRSTVKQLLKPQMAAARPPPLDAALLSREDLSKLKSLLSQRLATPIKKKTQRDKPVDVEIEYCGG